MTAPEPPVEPDWVTEIPANINYVPETEEDEVEDTPTVEGEEEGEPEPETSEVPEEKPSRSLF